MAEPSPNAIYYPDGKLAIDPTPKQIEFLTSAAPWLLLWGNRGGGKSLICRWRCHLMAMAHPDFRYAVIRNTLGELRRTHIDNGLVKEMERLGGSFHRTENAARYPNGSIGYFVGVDDESSMLKLLGGEYGLIFIDEITTVDWSTTIDVASCLRGGINVSFIPQLIAACNPFGVAKEDVRRHWITKDVEHNKYKPERFHAIQIGLEDNPHLDADDYREKLEMQTHPEKRAAWLDGVWTAAGAFFSNFRETKDDQPWHVITDLPEVDGRSVNCSPAVPVYRAIDWGFDDPTVCLWIAVLPDDRAIVFKERTWTRTAVADVAASIIAESEGLQVVDTFCDPSMDHGKGTGAQSVLNLFELNGVPMTKSVNDRRLYSIHEYLTRTIDGLPRLQFWAYGCPTLIETLPKQRNNKRDPERMADSKTDHHVLALSYFCSGGVTGRDVEPPPQLPRWMQPVEGSRLVLGNESVQHRRY